MFKYISRLSFAIIFCLAIALVVFGSPLPDSDHKVFTAPIPVLIQDGSLKNENNPVKILAFGDMMLDRDARKVINKYGPEFPFLLIKDFLIGNDIVVANAEGPFTSYPSETLINSAEAPLKFTFDPAVLPTLKNLGFTLFSQANNHALNFGNEGLRQSEQFIESAGINWFGDPRNKDVHPYITTIRGIKIAFIGYHEFAYSGLENVITAIQSAKQDGAFVIVYPHWGIEYNGVNTGKVLVPFS